MNVSFPSTGAVTQGVPTIAAPRMARQPQLDALRGVAIMWMMLVHFSPTLNFYLSGAGVRLFLVLSGFLITGILLRAKSNVEAGRSRVGAEVRRFLQRRSLRILPPLALLLLVNWTLNIGPTREDVWWHATLTSNWLMGLRGEWRGELSHLWSLAVDQQFYLVWPWVILVAGRCSARVIIGVMIAAGPLTRLGFVLFVPENGVAPYIVTPACLDLLGCGALLAWLYHGRGANDRSRARWRRMGLALLPVALLLNIPMPDGLRGAQIVLVPTLHALAFTAVVDGAALGYRGVAGRLLTWGPLLWIGQISYSIYLFHNNAHWFAPRFFRIVTNYQVAYAPGEFLHVLYMLVLALLAATASWFLLERPLTKFRQGRPDALRGTGFAGT